MLYACLAVPFFQNFSLVNKRLILLTRGTKLDPYICGSVDVGVDLVGAGVCGAQGWDLSTFSHLCFMGDDVHFYLPSDGNHFLSRGWLLTSNASLVILGLHLVKGLLAEECVCGEPTPSHAQR